MGKSKSLDTEDPPGEGGCLMRNCPRTLEESCQTCSERDKARDLELNKVEKTELGRLDTNLNLLVGNVRRVQPSGG